MAKKSVVNEFKRVDDGRESCRCDTMWGCGPFSRVMAREWGRFCLFYTCSRCGMFVGSFNTPDYGEQ